MTPIHQIIYAIASIVVLSIAHAIFNPMINGFLYSIAMDALANPTGNLLINFQSLKLSADIIVMGMKVFVYMVAFAVLFRLFVYVGFLTEEQGVY